MIAKAVAQMGMCSSLRSIGEYLGSPPWHEIRSTEEEKQRYERLVLQLEYLEKTLAEPDITHAVSIHATIARLNTELSIAEHSNYHGNYGKMLAAGILAMRKAVLSRLRLPSSPVSTG